MVPAHQVEAIVPAASRRHGAGPDASSRLRRPRLLTMSALGERLKRKAVEEGFDAAGFTAARINPAVARRLSEFMALGWHGDMGWLEETSERRGDPAKLWP